MSTNRPRILIAENDPVTRDMIRHHLEEAGYLCTHAMDGHQAIELVQQRRFDLILLEHQMPGMNGGEIAQHIRQQYSETRLPVIMMLRPGEEELAAVLLKRGTNDILGTPLRMPELLARIDKQLQYSRWLAEAEGRLASAREALAEEKRLHAREKHLLEVNRRRLKKIIQACPSVIYVTRASGDFRCVFASDHLLDVMGYRPAEMTGSETFWFDHIHPDDETRVTREFLDAIRLGSGRLKYRFRHQDGHYLLVEDDFEILHDEQGQPQEILGAWTAIGQTTEPADEPWLTPSNG